MLCTRSQTADNAGVAEASPVETASLLKGWFRRRGLSCRRALLGASSGCGLGLELRSLARPKIGREHQKHEDASFALAELEQPEGYYLSEVSVRMGAEVGFFRGPGWPNPSSIFWIWAAGSPSTKSQAWSPEQRRRFCFGDFGSSSNLLLKQILKDSSRSASEMLGF